MPTDPPDHFYPETREDWRAWLQEHHATARRVWLVHYKKETGRPSVPYAEAVEEALCFGWIDSVRNTLDAERYRQLYSRRKPRSPWSRLNKQRIQRLMDEGLIAPAGLAAIEAAKTDGSWDSYDTIEELTVPEDLTAALDANPAAASNFAAFPPSSKKAILWWIQAAKRPATRSQRIAETVREAAENRRANHYRQ